MLELLSMTYLLLAIVFGFTHWLLNCFDMNNYGTRNQLLSVLVGFFFPLFVIYMVYKVFNYR